MNYTKIQHNKPYAAISLSLPQLSAALKTVLIAGGSAGIGKATALAFLQAGCARLALTGRRADVVSATASELKKQYPKAEILDFAVNDANGMDDAFASAKARLGGSAVDVVVNCTGHMASLAPVATADLEDWWLGFEANVKGAAVLARAVARHAAVDAVVLQLGTAGVLFPANAAMPMSGYAASKLAAIKVMEFFGAENPEMRVVGIHPGIVGESEMGRKMTKESGMEWPSDDINLPAQFLVWAASDEAVFLKNKFVFAGWDVEELKQRKDEIANTPELILGLNGFP
ncbi:Uu.00g046160.m01.CDS01 [Anthostomella pinea]|uniref:Uu.00g046160.m01.CDS01 n=1 Tax=Anthostomella pinea TaxID=933095 RepID=A0AAI8VBE0_9PEZI|nr:Uu.00g046160.m01.CDS01 [Anthostomella pinea]